MGETYYNKKRVEYFFGIGLKLSNTAIIIQITECRGA